MSASLDTTTAAPSDTRVSTGNREADLVLGGGFLPSSINIVMGEPGTGKTLFAEQLLFANADGDRPVLYLTTLSEPLSKVITSGYTDDEMVRRGLIEPDHPFLSKPFTLEILAGAVRVLIDQAAQGSSTR